MITQEKIDNYNYMLKASEGIILIKPIKSLLDRVEKNEYRQLEDILNDIDKISDSCNCIGIGIDPYSKTIYNKEILSFNFIENILDKIISKFLDTPILIFCKISELTYEKLIKLKKYNNIELAIDLYDTCIINNKININNILNDLNQINKYNFIMPKIRYVYIPYYYLIKIDKMTFKKIENTFIDSIFYFYNCDNNINENNEYFKYIYNLISKNNIYTYENIFQSERVEIFKILDNELIKNIDLKENDIILEINFNKIYFIEDVQNIFNNEYFNKYNLKILRNNNLIELNIDIIGKVLLNNIIFKNTPKIIDIYKLYMNLYYNKNNSLIVYPKNNFDIFIKKMELITNDKSNHFLAIEENNISFEYLLNILNKYRSNNSDILITEIFIPSIILRKILNDGKKDSMSFEDFQRAAMVAIEEF